MYPHPTNILCAMEEVMYRNQLLITQTLSSGDHTVKEDWNARQRMTQLTATEDMKNIPVLHCMSGILCDEGYHTFFFKHTELIIQNYWCTRITKQFKHDCRTHLQSISVYTVPRCHTNYSCFTHTYCTHWIGGLEGLSTCLDAAAREKLLPLQGNQPK